MIPALANEDRLPHERAVWREGRPESVHGMGGRLVSVDYGGGLIEQTFCDQVAWERAVRWRWGWSPSR